MITQTHLVALLGVALLVTSAEGQFVAPEIGPIPFRRDRILLSADAQRSLAEDLVTLGKKLPAKTALQRRSKAQVLALALAVDPGSQDARETVAKLTGNELVEVQELKPKDLDSLWRTAGWLKDAPGDDNEALACCLNDVLAIYQPEDKRSLEWLKQGKTGAWSNWVPDTDAYQSERIAASGTSPTPAPAPKVEKASFKLASAAVRTLAYESSGDDMVRQRWVVVQLEMTNSAAKEFSVEGDFAKWPASLAKQISTRHPNLPKGKISLSLKTGKTATEPLEKGRGSAAAYVLVDAALSGQEPNAIVMGKISDDGSYQLPSDFWRMVRDLAETEGGGRLVMPVAAAEYLPALLTMGKPDFFQRYEVCLASTVDELIMWSSKAPPPQYADALTRYESLIAGAKTTSLPRYLADPPVRQQLVEIARSMPYHASSRMLALQAVGQRPITYPRKVVAYQVQDIIEKMKWLGTAEYLPGSSAVTKMELGHDAIRLSLGELEKVTDNKDKDLLKEAEELQVKLRALVREYKTKGEYYSEGDVTPAFTAYVKAYRLLQEHLKAAKSDT